MELLEAFKPIINFLAAIGALFIFLGLSELNFIFFASLSAGLATYCFVQVVYYLALIDDNNGMKKSIKK